MNRIIKFRAWDGDQMINDFVRVGEDGHFYGHGTGADEYIPMQFTGLTDKSGVEIFEGDIVRWHRKCDGSDWLENSEVKYMEGGFVIGKDLELLMVFYPHCEVIGNIHEHPHLLK